MIEAILDYLKKNSKNAREAQLLIQMLAMSAQSTWVATRNKQLMKDLDLKAETGSPEDNKRFRDLIKMLETETVASGQGMLERIGNYIEVQIIQKGSTYGLEELETKLEE